MYRHLKALGGDPQARVIGDAELCLPAHHAALLNGIAGHAMDWDDTQLAESPGRVYGLLTHPTIPPLSAALAIADMVGGINGKTFMTAFISGFEVECKIAEAINPDHYVKGFHTSGTVGTFGAVVCASKLLGLNAAGFARAIGIATSMASGIRANFGTMTKPLHVGRAAENGVTAAILAREGFTANMEALDGQWGYLAVAGRGGNPEFVVGRFGNPFSIISPGVSIKPYPCGVLTHPSMDTMLLLMRDHKLSHAQIRKVKLYAGSNILGPIRYERASNELEAKFCMPFLLSAIIIAGKAGKSEFTKEFVQSPLVQDIQRRVETFLDPSIEKLGFDRIRSRIEVETVDGRILVREADENYRGGPNNPLSDAELENKFRDCAAGLISDEQCQLVFDTVWKLEEQPDVTTILALLNWRGGRKR
jgi:2-methylcitrate dehydratase PrpD